MKQKYFKFVHDGVGDGNTYQGFETQEEFKTLKIATPCIAEGCGESDAGCSWCHLGKQYTMDDFDVNDLVFVYETGKMYAVKLKDIVNDNRLLYQVKDDYANLRAKHGEIYFFYGGFPHVPSNRINTERVFRHCYYFTDETQAREFMGRLVASKEKKNPFPYSSILWKIYEIFKVQYQIGMCHEGTEELVRDAFWVQFGRKELRELYKGCALPYSDTGKPPSFDDWFDDYASDTTYELLSDLGMLDDDGLLKDEGDLK